jgi:hypothetical protein
MYGYNKAVAEKDSQLIGYLLDSGHGAVEIMRIKPKDQKVCLFVKFVLRQVFGLHAILHSMWVQPKLFADFLHLRIGGFQQVNPFYSFADQLFFSWHFYHCAVIKVSTNPVLPKLLSWRTYQALV